MEVSRPNTPVLQQPVKIEREFHQAETSWAREQLYGTMSKCSTTWKHFRWLGAKIDKMRNSKFACHTFTTYGKYQDAVIKAVAKNKLNPTDKSKAALNRSLDQLVDFIEKKTHGRKTFDLSDNRSLLFFTARKEILAAGRSSGITSDDLEGAFYNKVVHVQVTKSTTNGIDIVRDFDAIVKGIDLMGFNKTPVQIEADAALDFGRQWHPDPLRKMPEDLSSISGQRNKEEVQDNIRDKAWILVNYSKTKITADVVRQTLGDDFSYIEDPRLFVATLEDMRTAKAKEAKLVQNVAEADKASKEAEAAWKQAAHQIEKLEKDDAIRKKNSNLFGMINPVLEQIDGDIIALIEGDQPIDGLALQAALKNRTGLIDNIQNLADDLKKVRNLEQEGDLQQKLSPLEIAQVKLCIRQHFTLDNPVEGSIRAFLEHKRTASTVNPTSAQIKEYLVWGAEKEYQEKLLEIVTAQKNALLPKQQQERHQLAIDTVAAKELRKQQLDNAKQQLNQARTNSPVDQQLKTALDGWGSLLQLPKDLKDADNLKLEARNWAGKVANEIYDTNSGDKTLNEQAVQDNQKYLVQLTKDIPSAIGAWIKVEEKYLADVTSAEKAYADDIATIEQKYQTASARMIQRQELAVKFCQIDIDECTAKITECASKISNSIDFRSPDYRQYVLTPDYVCDLALRLNYPNKEFKSLSEDALQNIFTNLAEILDPFIGDSKRVGFGVKLEKMQAYIKAVLLVHSRYEAKLNSELGLMEAKLDLDSYRSQLFLPATFTMQDYLDDVEAGTKTTLDGFIKDRNITNPDVTVALTKKNKGVKNRVNMVFEHTIQHTWDEMTKDLRVEEIWKNAIATRLMRLGQDISGEKELHEADVQLLTRARQFAPQVELTADQRTAIAKADVNHSQAWDETTIDAYGILLLKCHDLILSNKLQLNPAAVKPVEQLSVPIVPKKNEKEEEDDEKPLVPTKKQKAESKEPNPLNEFVLPNTIKASHPSATEFLSQSTNHLNKSSKFEVVNLDE